MAFEWVAGLFQSEQTRGLSGDTAHTVALDESNPYYNYRLRRHRAEGDLVADPGLLWYTSPYVKRRSGLGTHVGAEIGEGTANYTDVLLVLSREDAARAGSEWRQQAIRTLQQEFENFCRRENFSRLHAHRPLGFRIFEDGAPEMGGVALGLKPGEFVTGLLPNLYTGPVRGSFPVIGVHLNLPGAWEGYREVGRLHNDQILFTLGNHWLDNFSHPSLQQAALYRLRQYPDGSFVHIINPDLQDRYQVTSTNQGGASVLTLATRGGQPLAYMVLAVIDPPSRASAPPDTPSPSKPPPGPRRPDIALPKPPSKPARPAAEQRGEGVPSIAPPMLLDDVGSADLGGKTIIPDAPSERIFTLQERGALLQKVHFSAFMLGYDVFVGKRGELGTHVEEAAATFQVRKRSVSVIAHVDGVVVGGRPVPPGVEVPVEGDVRLEIAGQRLEYRDLRGMRVDGWPYVGEIRRPASSTYMIWGEDYQVGRSRECRVVLPDEPRNDNIHWKPSVGDGATIRARTGEIPKSRFYTDSIMVASEHATIDLRADAPQVVCNARHCFVYVRRGDEVLPLYPSSSGEGVHQIDVQPGDEILIGNCLFHVGFTPAEQAVAPAPAPKVELTSSDEVEAGERLADAVKAPDLADLDADSVPPAPTREVPPPPGASPSPEDAPDRDGAPPPPVRPASLGADSIIGEPSSPPSLERSEPLELGAEDDPTMPGLVMPHDLDDLPAFESASDPDAADDDEEAPPPPRLDDSWEEDAEPDSPAPPPAPVGDEGRASEVPPPFPEVEEEGAEAGADEAETREGPPPVPEVEPPPMPEAETPPPVPEAPPVPEVPPAPEAETPPPVPEAPPPVPEATTPPPAPEATTPPPAPEATTPPPAPEAAPALAAAPPAPVAEEPSAPSEAPAREVVFTSDEDAQFELGRPMHLILCGWMVNGEVVCGNHREADLVIPENRIHEEQVFEARDYFRLKIRGRRGHAEVLAPTELLVDEDDPKQERYDDPTAHVFDVIRRDDAGEEDFVVRLKILEDRSLPDPRARLVALDFDDPLAAALVTRGLPKGQPRELEIDGVHLSLLFDGEKVRVSDYLATYQRDGGFHPFFVRHGEGRFVTAPEDGSAFELHDGDRMVIGACVYVLRAE